MDIFTHSIGWYLLKKNFFDINSKKILSIFLISSIFPDIDILWSYNNINLHRVFTHSLLISPFISTVLSIFFFYIFKKEIKFKTIFIICISWILLHLFLDSILIWGIPLFWPLSNIYYSLNLYTYVIEPMFLPIYLLFLILLLKIFKNIWNKTIKIISIYILIIFFIKFSINLYMHNISGSKNDTIVWIVNTSSDLFIQRYYKSINIDGSKIKWKVIDLYKWKVIEVFEKKVYINNNWYCSNLHNWFLYIENWIIWDIRYTITPKDSWSCFTWLKIN